MRAYVEVAGSALCRAARRDGRTGPIDEVFVAALDAWHARHEGEVREYVRHQPFNRDVYQLRVEGDEEAVRDFLHVVMPYAWQG